MAAVSFGSLVHESPTIFSLYDETVTKEGEREREHVFVLIKNQ